MSKPFRIGVDTGGTFTDVVVIDDAGRVTFDKAFSTPKQPAAGVLSAIDYVASRLEHKVQGLLENTTRFCHGTTVGTNALIERKGARVGLVTTKGFEDTLHIARGPLGRTGGLQYQQAMDFIHTEPPPPLVPHWRTRGVSERTTADREVLVALSKDEVVHVARELLATGIDSLAVCLLWSFRNNTHERLIRDIVSEVAAGLPVSLSCEIAPLLGEFERTVTTVINAYVGPVLDGYVGALHQTLVENGLRSALQLMKSSGGLTMADQAASQAVSLINSGPAGGLVAAKHLGALLGYRNLITTDMGGTSFDVGLIAGGEYEYDERPFLDQGLPVQIPALKVVTIGAGGGSIAWTDGKRLRVGPRSSGAEPGPACYGRGGTEPTVTDALLLMGILNPRSFFGGRSQLDPARAEAAVNEQIAQPLALETMDGAAGIYEIVTANMADLIRKVTIESGRDPREFALVSYGGAGPAHCALFAERLGIREVIVPHTAAVFSALGIALSDITFAYSQSEPVLLAQEERARPIFASVFKELLERARRDLSASGLDPSSVTPVYKLDLRYVGQLNEVTLTWDYPSLPAGSLSELRRRFEELYESRFGQGTTRRDAELELISFRLEVWRPTEYPIVPELDNHAGGVAKAKERRKIYLRGSGWVSGEVYDFEDLVPGQELHGPALIERPDTVILVPPGMLARIDSYCNVRINVRRRSSD